MLFVCVCVCSDRVRVVYMYACVFNVFMLFMCVLPPPRVWLSFSALRLLMLLVAAVGVCLLFNVREFTKGGLVKEGLAIIVQ